MNTLERWLSFLAVGAACVVLAFFGGYLKGCSSATQKAAVAQAKAEAAAQGKADALSADNAKLSQSVTQARSALSQLNAALAALPPAVRIVYAHPKPTPQNPAPAPVAITGPVYVSAGAVSLYNAALGTAGVFGSGLPDGTPDLLPSAITVGDYEDTAVYNAGACTVNTKMLVGLQSKVRDWVAAGAIKIVNP